MTLRCSVVDGVEGKWPSAVRAAALAVPGLVGGLGDDRDDAALAQVGADRAGGVGLVAAQPVRTRPRPAERSRHPQLGQQWQCSRGVAGLAWRDRDHQRQAVAID